MEIDRGCLGFLAGYYPKCLLIDRKELGDLVYYISILMKQIVNYRMIEGRVPKVITIQQDANHGEVLRFRQALLSSTY